MTPILQAAGLHTYYGASHILRGIDLTIMPGQAIGLMGRNGMGKTTLIRTLLGLVPMRSGQVLVDGQDVAGQRPHVRARHGILDEATEGLAPLMRDEIWRTIALIRQDGIATLVVDRTVTAVLSLVDRATVLVKGQVGYDGDPGTLAGDQALLSRYLGV